jgi:hypothetical protein
MKRILDMEDYTAPKRTPDAITEAAAALLVLETAERPLSFAVAANAEPKEA